jgi:hypothetical protein
MLKTFHARSRTLRLSDSPTPLTKEAHFDALRPNFFSSKRKNLTALL